jgi:hypothetical protein
VKPGESLWSIAEATLPAGASAAEVAASSAAWYDTNRAVIGANPSLIHPGQDLAAPDAEAAR